MTYALAVAVAVADTIISEQIYYQEVFAHCAQIIMAGRRHKEEMKAFSFFTQIKRRCGKRGICQFVNSCFVIDDANGIVDDLTKRKDLSHSAMAIYTPFFFALQFVFGEKLLRQTELLVLMLA
jgi:hypothetical protein